MVPAGVSGAIVAAAVSRKRRRLIATFRAQGATSAATAKSLSELGLSSSVLLQIQKLRGVIVDDGHGRMFLDEARAAVVDRTRRLLIPAIILVVTAIVFLLLWWTDRP